MTCEWTKSWLQIVNGPTKMILIFGIQFSTGFA